MLKRLWNDDAGFVVSFELVLVATVLVIGLTVGLVSVRNAMHSELVELARAIANIDQGYNYCGLTGCCASSAGSGVVDTDGVIDTNTVTHLPTDITSDVCNP